MDQKGKEDKTFFPFYSNPANLSCRQNSSTLKAKPQTFPGISKVNVNDIQLLIHFLSRTSVLSPLTKAYKDQQL